MGRSAGRPARLPGGEVSGGGGNMPRLMGRQPTGQRGGPGFGQPVSQIEGVADKPGCCSVRHAQHTTQLGGGKIPHRRSALPAKQDRTFDAREPTGSHSLAGVQVGPMCCDLQSPGFGGDQDVFVGFGGGEGAGRVQLHQIIFEHRFNIWVGADTPGTVCRITANGQHPTNLDNTMGTARQRPGALLCLDDLRLATLHRLRPQVSTRARSSARQLDSLGREHLMSRPGSIGGAEAHETVPLPRGPGG
jgi:hypothetical protein